MQYFLCAFNISSSVGMEGAKWAYGPLNSFSLHVIIGSCVHVTPLFKSESHIRQGHGTVGAHANTSNTVE